MDARSVANKTKKMTQTKMKEIIGKKCSNAAEPKKQVKETEKQNTGS